MAKTPKIDPKDQIAQLQAELAERDSRIAKLESRAKKHREHALIPRPKGQAGRGSGSRSGGYNLQEAMGLKDSDEDYNRRSRIVKRYIHEYLSVFKPISQQESGRVSKMIALVSCSILSRHVFTCLVQIQKDIPFFSRFENGWPIRDIARTYLSNEKTRRRADLDAEQEAVTPGSTTRRLDGTLKKTKRVQVVESTEIGFGNSDSDADDEGDHKMNKKVSQTQTFPSKKRPVILSSAESAADTDTDLERLVRSKKTHKAPPAQPPKPAKLPKKSKEKMAKSPKKKWRNKTSRSASGS
ncbi:hypothetical protein B0H12DRAFT_169097 [Mycena haematopus]|nr:hypothetical protein B0H12DRAFT_169097 [Mycena haematopus]